jgi:hypothetical protein
MNGFHLHIRYIAPPTIVPMVVCDRMASMSEVEHNKTFRLDIEASRLLAQEAKDRNASANAIINRLILKSLKRERALSALKTIHVPSLTMRLVTESLPDERMAEIGREMAEDVLLKDIPFEVSGCMSTQSVLDTMKLLYEVHESELDGRKVVFLVHYSGAKWSLLCGSFWKALFASVGTKVDFSTDDNAVVFKF